MTYVLLPYSTTLDLSSVSSWLSHSDLASTPRSPITLAKYRLFCGRTNAFLARRMAGGTFFLCMAKGATVVVIWVGMLMMITLFISMLTLRKSWSLIVEQVQTHPHRLTIRLGILPQVVLQLVRHDIAEGVITPGHSPVHLGDVFGRSSVGGVHLRLIGTVPIGKRGRGKGIVVLGIRVLVLVWVVGTVVTMARRMVMFPPHFRLVVCFWLMKGLSSCPGQKLLLWRLFSMVVGVAEPIVGAVILIRPALQQRWRGIGCLLLRLLMDRNGGHFGAIEVFQLPGQCVLRNFLGCQLSLGRLGDGRE